MASSRQGKSVSKAAGSRSLRGCLDLGSSRDHLHLIDSRAVGVTQSVLQKRLWPVGWWGLKIWEPTSGLLLLPPCGRSFFSCGCSLSSRQPPLPRTLNMPTLRALVLSPSANPYCDQDVSIYNVSPPPNPLQLQRLLSIVLFACKHGLVPTEQVN